MTPDYHSHPYVRQLNEWHLEVAILRDLVNHILSEIDGPEWICSAAHLAQHRFTQLVESFPFPLDSHLAETQDFSDRHDLTTH